MKQDTTAMYILAIVVIVGAVAILSLVMGHSTTTVTGQAIGPYDEEGFMVEIEGLTTEYEGGSEYGTMGIAGYDAPTLEMWTDMGWVSQIQGYDAPTLEFTTLFPKDVKPGVIHFVAVEGSFGYWLGQSQSRSHVRLVLENVVRQKNVDVLYPERLKSGALYGVYKNPEGTLTVLELREDIYWKLELLPSMPGTGK